MPRRRADRECGGLLRLLGAALVAAVVTAVFVGGLGSRLVMWVISQLASSHHGEITHDGAVMGQITVDGTLAIVVTALFMVPPAFVLYLLVRRALPARRRRKAAAAALFFGVVGFPLVVDVGNYEYYRYVSPALAFSLFFGLIAVGGATMSWLTEWWADGITRRPRSRVADAILTVAAAAAFGLALWADITALRSVSSTF